jgi:hypothetical protein
LLANHLDKLLLLHCVQLRDRHVVETLDNFQSNGIAGHFEAVKQRGLPTALVQSIAHLFKALRRTHTGTQLFRVPLSPLFKLTLRALLKEEVDEPDNGNEQVMHYRIILTGHLDEEFPVGILVFMVHSAHI